MFRIFVLICCLSGTLNVLADDNIMSMGDDNVNCGPLVCSLSVTHMCFFTSKFTTDKNNVSFIQSCGTCLDIKGSVIQDRCETASTHLTNYTDRISINLLNSTVDSSRLRNGVVGLLLSEMANESPTSQPSVQVTTPSTSYTAPVQTQPIVVVQPPAQTINVYSGPPPYGYGRYETTRADQKMPNNLCNPSSSDCPPSINKSNQFRNNHPNDLPPQVDKMYRLIANMQKELNQMNDALSDAQAGATTGYLADGFLPAKNPFPVWTPGKK